MNELDRELSPREQLLESIPFEGSAGVVYLVLQGALALGAIALTLFLMRILFARVKRTRIPPPNWGGPEVLYIMVGWLLLQVFVGALTAQILQPLPLNPLSPVLEIYFELPTRTILGLMGGAIAGLLTAGAILHLPKLHGQAFQVLGLGTGSLFQGGVIGALAWLFAIPGGFAIIMLWSISLLLLGVEPDPQPVTEFFVNTITSGSWSTSILIIMFGVVIAPIVEELLFRALLFRWLEKRFNTSVGVVLSAIMFGAIHGSLVAFLPIALLGALLAILLHRTGNVWTCIGLHVVFNAGQFFLMWVTASYS